jgi:hypothetical protein
MDVYRRYKSEDLFPLFKNRLPSRGRADAPKLQEWLNLRGDESQFDLLARFGLIPGTDSILVYPEPVINDDKYTLEFFVHGIRHMHADVPAFCQLLQSGDLLLPMLDVQNPVDPKAVALRPPQHAFFIGYVPTFYATDVSKILSDAALAPSARVTVVRNNLDAPFQLRLHCRFEALVPPGFKPLDTDAHKPMVKGQCTTPGTSSSAKPIALFA